MSSYFWLCKANCTWKSSDEFHNAIRRSGVRGSLRDFDTLDKAIKLGNNDVFCLEGLGKAELSTDLVSGTGAFDLQAAGGGDLFFWGHHSGFNDLVYLVVVSDLNAVHLNPRGRPETWSQKAGPLKAVGFPQFQVALNNW